MRLIDADRLLEILKREEAYHSDLPQRADGVRDAIMDVISAPSVDAVEVVRCEDCRWGKKVCGNIECFVDSNIPPEYHGYE